MSQNPYEPSGLPADGAACAPQVPEPTNITQLFAVGQFAVGLVAGFVIWVITAPREAWDANPGYSLFVLFAGLMSSLFRFRGSWWGVFGVYLGQVAGLSLLVPHTGVPIFPAWLGVLMCGTIQAAIGAILGGAVGFSIWWLRRRSILPR